MVSKGRRLIILASVCAERSRVQRMRTKPLPFMFRIAVLYIFFTSAVTTVGSYEIVGESFAERPDWDKAERDTVAILVEQQTDIAELTTEVRTSEAKTAQETMVKLNVFMRAGITEAASETAEELKELCPDLASHQVALIYLWACDKFSAWEVAQRLAEVFADNISGIELENRLLKHFQRSGWDVNDIDQWLAAMPKGIDSFWVKERLRFNMVHGEGERFVLELMNRVKRNPQDIERAIAFLDGLIYVRHYMHEECDLSWMMEAIEPKLATEAEHIASRLKTLTKWTTATMFYKRAIDIPLTDQELKSFGVPATEFCERTIVIPPTNQKLKRLGTMYEAFISSEKARFAARVREGMAECLLKVGRAEEAQKWMVEAADIRKKHNLGLNALLAGQVQAQSGQRVIESRLREEEKKSENDPEYWRQRARYYRGRNEPDQEVQALRKGLALATGNTDWYCWLLSDYADFLARVKRPEEAVALFRDKVENAPASSQLAERAANLLAFDFYKYLSVADEVLWTWLANRPKWGHTEERLLWRMLERAKTDELDKYLLRAEEYTSGKDASRASVLGWIMNHMDLPKRSIPLLKYAIETAHDHGVKRRAVFTLFESYLDVGDWKLTEQVFQEASKCLTAKEVPEYHLRMAVAAAAAGDKADAMRFWRGVANVNPAALSGLDELIKFGLRDELVAFYGEMAKKMPSSEVPARALGVLEEK